MTTTGQTTATSRTASRTVHARRLLTSLLIAVVAVVGLNLSPASAWSQVSGSGSYGAVTLRGVAAQGAYFKEPGALYGQTVPHLNVRGVVAGRSPATSGYQSVTYKFVVYRSTGSSWTYWGENWIVTQGIPRATARRTSPLTSSASPVHPATTG